MRRGNVHVLLCNVRHFRGSPIKLRWPYIRTNSLVSVGPSHSRHHQSLRTPIASRAFKPSYIAVSLVPVMSSDLQSALQLLQMNNYLSRMFSHFFLGD